MTTMMTQTAFIDRILPAPVGGGLAMDDWWIWCGSVVRGDDGRYHMFASRWPRALPFTLTYPLRSEIVRAVANTPEGPYTFAEVVLPQRDEAFWDGRMTHNPTIHKWRGRYYLYYIGSTYSGRTLQPGDPIDEAIRLRSRQSWFNIRIGLATSERVEGPWLRREKPILDIRPDSWDYHIVTNPAVCIHDNGRTLMVYRTPGSVGALLGIAGADHPAGPFRRLSQTPIFKHDPIIPRSVEDPFIWFNGTDYEMIAKDNSHTMAGEHHAGVHVMSHDAIDWRLCDPPKAWSRRVRWSDGSITTQGSLERPQLLFNDQGVPTHLFAATADGPGGFSKATRTWNMVMPLRFE